MSMKSAQRFGLIAPANQICLSIRVWPIKYNFHSKNFGKIKKFGVQIVICKQKICHRRYLFFVILKRNFCFL